MSIFSEAWAAASVNIDTFYGEAWTFQPMAYVGGARKPDPARGPVQIVGALDDPAAFDDPIGKRVAHNTVEQHATTHATLDIASDALPWRPRNHDRAIRAADGAIYEITGVRQDSFARISLRVVRLGAAG